MLWLQLAALLTLVLGLVVAGDRAMWSHPGAVVAGRATHVTKAVYATWVLVPMVVAVAILLWSVWVPR